MNAAELLDDDPPLETAENELLDALDEYKMQGGSEEEAYDYVAFAFGGEHGLTDACKKRVAYDFMLNRMLELGIDVEGLCGIGASVRAEGS